jgi:hypothetical protein
VLLLAAAGVSAALATAGSSQTGHPQLHLMDASPVTVRATGFEPRERVNVVLRDPALATRTMTTGSGGAFTVTFPHTSASSCAGFSVIATAADGAKATLKRAPGQCALP